MTPPPFGRCIVAIGLAVTISCQLPVSMLDQAPPPSAPPIDLSGKRLVLAPVTVPDDVPVGEWVVAVLDSMIEHGLRARGHDVVSPREYAAIWDSLTAAAGGFFDPYTGRRHDVAYDSAVVILFKILADRFDPDVLLYPGLWVVEAEVAWGYASWDGYREYFDLRVGDGTVVLGLSLVLSAEDMKGVGLFERGTGVRLIERYWASTGMVGMVDSVDVRLTESYLSGAAGRVLHQIGRADTTLTDSVSRW